MDHLFPVLFPLFWTAITCGLGHTSRWHWLMKRYPDRPDDPAVLELGQQSGQMGHKLNYGGVLRLGVCKTGLRVSIFRLFGPFCRPFFVPWEEITIERGREYLIEWADLRFGTDGDGHLKLPARTADRLRAAMPDRWPKDQPLPQMEPAVLRTAFAKQWLVGTLTAGTFFAVATRLQGQGPGFPIPICYGFPAVVFGLGTVMRYFHERR